MNELLAASAAWCREVVRAWDRFWFTPQQPHTLSLIRICGGAMLLYTHLVWTLDLEAFFGPHSWLTASTVRQMTQDADGSNYTWSHLYWIESPALLWAAHLAALVVFLLLTIGLWTRVVSVLACLVTLSYCHRATGVWFGLDQINAFIAMYLMVGSAGGAYSVDRWLATRGGAAAGTVPRIDTNVAVRLLQVHLCIVYLFGGIGKARGLPWWDGTAMSAALTIQEYQSLDLLWMLRYPALLALLTHLTVFWEMFYCVLIWPKLTRPICLLLAVLVHGGIALGLGMKTFGLAMLIANLAFIYPEYVQATIGWLCRWVGGRRLAARQAIAEPPRQNSFATSR
jgi:uncharacterized membrane protein YphA (DoxX/SURF4 family)